MFLSVGQMSALAVVQLELAVAGQCSDEVEAEAGIEPDAGVPFGDSS